METMDLLISIPKGLPMIISNINKDSFERMVKCGLVDKNVLAKAEVSVSESNYEVNGKRSLLVTIVTKDDNAISGADYLKTMTADAGSKPAAPATGSALKDAASK